MAAPGQEEEMAGECILVEKSEGVAILTMNRPEQLNAMSYQLSTELHDAVTRMGADDEVGCITLSARAAALRPQSSGRGRLRDRRGGRRRIAFGSGRSHA